MQKTTFLAVALAAGVMNFAIATAHGEPLRFRKDEGLTVQLDKTKTAAVAKPEAKTAKSKAKAGKVAAKATKTADKVKGGKGKTRKGEAGRTKIQIDTTTTASIPRTGDAKAVSPGTAGSYSTIIARYAASYGVPVSLARAVIKIESNYRPHLTGSAGEVGLMQIKPATARMLGYSGSVKGLYDPETNIKYGMKYLAMAQDLSDGSTCGIILKYNAGHGAKRMNPVSSAYCSKVKIQMASAATAI